MFIIVSGAFLAFAGPQHENEAHRRRTTEDYMVPPPWIPLPSTMAYRRHEAEWIAAGFRPNASGVSDMDRFWEMERRPCCRLIIVRSCPEAEPPMFPLLARLFAKPVVPAGLLLPNDAAYDEADDGALNSDGNEPTSVAMRWLDAQPRRSAKNQFSSRALLARDPTGSVRAGLFSLFSTHPASLPTSAGPTSLSFFFFYSSTTECVRFLPSPHATKYVGAHNYHYRSFNWFSFPSYLQRSHTLSSI
jgi:hypothetical protein